MREYGVLIEQLAARTGDELARDAARAITELRGMLSSASAEIDEISATLASIRADREAVCREIELEVADAYLARRPDVVPALERARENVNKQLGWV